MSEKLAAVEARWEELGELMAQPDVATDHVRLQQIAREQRELEDVVLAFRSYKEVQRQIAEAQALLEGADDAELRELALEELEQLRRRRDQLDQQIRLLLLPSDPHDEKSVIVEIRQGEGGDEAALFAADLFRMYMRYAEQRSWRVEVVNANENGIGGFKEIVFEIQ